MTGEPATAEFPSPFAGRLLLSTCCDRWEEKLTESVALRPDEVVVIAVTAWVATLDRSYVNTTHFNRGLSC
jgi:hypothetical protein